MSEIILKRGKLGGLVDDVEFEKGKNEESSF